MIRRELHKLMNLLRADEYRTASQLADALGVSEKTVRLRIKDLNEDLEKYGAVIESKARFGYRMQIEDQQQFEFLEKEENAEAEEYIPDNGKERSEYLLAYLVWHRDYIKAEELCDFLYISRTTLTKAIKDVEGILKRYDLEIERKPNYGMKIKGRELDIRRLVCDYFIRREYGVKLVGERAEKQLVELAGCIRKILVKYEIPISETAFETFVEYVFVACKRMCCDHYLKIAMDEIPETGIREKAFTNELSEYLGKKYKCIVTKEEKSYILLYLSGKRMVGNIVENDNNFVILISG